MSHFALFVLFLAVPLSQGYTYHKEGADWEGVCATGQSQSPVNLCPSSATPTTDTNVNLNYNEMYSKAEFIPHTFMVPGEWGSMTYKTKSESIDTSAIQFHFHAPSENTVDGKLYPLEMHIVHKDASGNLHVIGIFFEEGRNNHFLEILQHGQSPVNLMMLFGYNNELHNFFNFSGSLTTPPCTEGVNWIVWSEVQTASIDQLKFFTSKWADSNEFANGKGNNRPPQPLNGRTITLRK